MLLSFNFIVSTPLHIVCSFLYLFQLPLLTILQDLSKPQSNDPQNRIDHPE